MASIVEQLNGDETLPAAVRSAAYAQLVEVLAGRLRMVADRKRFPGIDAERIEAIDAAPGAWPIMSADRVAKELGSLGRWLVETVRMFGGMQSASMKEFANAFKPQPVRADSDLPTIYHGFWDLTPDRALLIETPAPPVSYWGFQLSNSVWNTLDFVNRQASLNRGQARIDDDGMLRIVVSERDPGVANCWDTMGHRQGAIHVRLEALAGRSVPAGRDGERDLAATVNDWMTTWDDATRGEGPAAVHPVPRARLVAMADLAAQLPQTTPRVGAAEREAILAQRLVQVSRMQRS